MVEAERRVVDVLVQWALALPRPEGRTRINRRLVFGTPGIAGAVGTRLREASTSDRAWIVRSSADHDAVKLRNDRDGWVSPDAAVIYLVFWLPGHAGHERNFESLRDLPSVTLRDFLSRSNEFLLPGEATVVGQCEQASDAWPEKSRPRAKEHLLAAWNALRICMRERNGGAERSIPFVDDLVDYLTWLDAAAVPDLEWDGTPPSDRAGVLVSRWGSALPLLGMFHMPALASVLGIAIDSNSAIPSPSKTGETKWTSLVEEFLALNKDAATDFPGLEEDIAGKQTLRERLDELTARIPLCSSEAARPAAREALERFCQSGDTTALSQVEWLFLKDKGDRGSPSQGLRGLLIARKLRAPRPNPLDRLTHETIAILESLVGDETAESGVVRQYIHGLRDGAAKDRRGALEIAEILRALAGGVIPPSVTGTSLIQALTKILDAQGRDPQQFERLSRGWEKHGRPDADAPVATSSLLFGLVQLSYSRLDAAADAERQCLVSEGDQAGDLILSVHLEGSRVEHRTPVDDWSLERRTAIQRWLRDSVRPLVFEANDVDDDDEEDSALITIDVDRSRGQTLTPFGTIVLTAPKRTSALLRASRTDTLSSFQREGAVPGNRLLSELFESADTGKKGEEPDNEKLRKAWEGWVRALGSEAGWADIASVSPLPSEGRDWVEAWADSLECLDTGAAEQKELLELQTKIETDAIPDIEEVRGAMKRLAFLTKAQAAAPSTSLVDVRRLLSLCTGIVRDDGKPRQLVLTPHHPLTLRLRLVAEDILADTLQLLWNQGWDRRTLDDLEGAIAEWGPPEPMHCYGAWDGEPLVFEDWFGEGFALFSPLGAEREVDSLHIGAKQVASEMRKYSALFPASGDRLGVRFHADQRGEWAWRALAHREHESRFSADVQLMTDLPLRQPTYIDSLVQKEDLLGSLFEPGPDGSLPRLRVCRQSPSSDPAGKFHVSAVVGDLVEELRSVISLIAVPSEAPVYGIFDPRVYFYEAAPELRDYSFLVSDPPDKLSLSVSKAVALAAAHPGQVFRERYSFDETRCRHRLQRLQKDAHWLVLASRQPLYRAVQQCGTSALLDFYSAIERGRAVHVCVSLDAQRAEEDISRLRAMLESLLTATVNQDEARGVLLAARSLAPGLAMRCIGSTGSIALSGLIGLLLSARASEGDLGDGLLLALDQHRSLLSGSGQLGDLLRIRMDEGTVHIDVVEAKFSTTHLVKGSAPLQEAHRQVQSTIQRLAQFTLQHPLILRTRARLARAIVHRIHLGSPSQEQATRWSELIDHVLDPSVPIVVGTREQSCVHAWSINESTVDTSFELPEGERVHVHGRDRTLDVLRSLATQS